MREVTVKLKLISNWMGNPEGSIVTVGERQAKSMLSRKIAKIIIDKEDKKNNGKETAKENASGEIQTGQEKEVGKLQKRNMDKMIKGSINKE